MAAPLIPLLTAASGLIGEVLDLFQGDKKRQAEALLKEMEQAAAAQQGQIDINKTEAAHQSLFVAGWRPAIGWVCAASLATYYIPQHVLAAVFWVRASWGMQELLPYPINAEGLMELVFAMLGMGLLRSVDKLKRGAR